MEVLQSKKGYKMSYELLVADLNTMYVMADWQRDKYITLSAFFNSLPSSLGRVGSSKLRPNNFLN